jgi:hypothetical protein
MKQIDFILYLVCDGCRRIATFHGVDQAAVAARARQAGWVIRATDDCCSRCEKALRQKEKQ